MNLLCQRTSIHSFILLSFFYVITVYAAQSTITLQDDDPRLSYTGNWVYVTSPNFMGGTASRTIVSGSSVSLSIAQGVTGFTWITTSGQGSGSAKVAIDDDPSVLVLSAVNRSTSIAYGVIGFSVDSLDPTDSHRITITFVSSSSNNSHVDIDAIQYTVNIVQSSSSPSRILGSSSSSSKSAPTKAIVPSSSATITSSPSITSKDVQTSDIRQNSANSHHSQHYGAIIAPILAITFIFIIAAFVRRQIQRSRSQKGASVIYQEIIESNQAPPPLSRANFDAFDPLLMRPSLSRSSSLTFIGKPELISSTLLIPQSFQHHNRNRSSSIINPQVPQSIVSRRGRSLSPVELLSDQPSLFSTNRPLTPIPIVLNQLPSLGYQPSNEKFDEDLKEEIDDLPLNSPLTGSIVKQ